MARNLNLVMGRAMVHEFSCRPLTAKLRAESYISPSAICGGQSGTDIGFSISTSVSPSTIVPLLVVMVLVGVMMVVMTMLMKYFN